MRDFLSILESGNISEIESSLSARLAKNSAFFKENYPHIFSILLRDPKKYVLVVNEDDINIYNVDKKEFVYEKNKMIEASKTIAHMPLKNSLWEITNNNMALSYMNENDFPVTGHIINRMIKHALDTKELKEEYMHLPDRFLPVTTIFGLGGGLFLEYLIESHDYIHSLFIFEEIADFFRISCCFVDYPKLFSKVTPNSCFLFIENIIDRKLVKYFFSKNKITANFIRLSLMLYDTPKMQEVKKIVELEQNSNARGWGSFEDEMNGTRNALKNITIQKKSLDTPILYTHKKVDIPICVVGNGPSLDELLPFIKKNEDKMVIFSAGTAIKPLKNYQIEPDFHIEIERMPYLPRILKEVDIKDINLLCGQIVNSGVLELTENRFLFMRGSTSSGYMYTPRFIVEFSYPFVGNAAFALALLFSDTIIMCGLDAGYKKGRTKHAKGSIYKDEKAEIPEGALPVKGNFSDDIYADALFAHSREIMELAILNLKPKRVLNLSDGAYIKGAEPTRWESLELKITNKEPKIREIKRSFSKNKLEVFKNSGIDDVLDGFSSYKKELFEILKRDLKTKRELFERLDEANRFIDEKRQKRPYLGILLGGSVSHILYTIFLIFFHVHKNDIQKLYKELIAIFEAEFDAFLARYKTTMLLAKSEFL